MSDSPDMHLQLKKRARRRLVGAIAIAGLAAVVLPMVMDEEPKQQIQDVQIRIPGQDQTPFSPKVGKPLAAAASEKAAAPAAPAVAEKSVDKPADKPAEKATEKPAEKAGDRKPERAPEKAADKVADKLPPKPAEKPAEKPVEKPPAKASDSKASDSGQYLILIGAFSNPANVKQLQTKIGELGIKVITEPLDLPEGKKTRVRAGPFATREAAEKALEKIKRIGVGGVVAVKQ